MERDTSFGNSIGATLKWSGRDIAYLRVKKKKPFAPLFAAGFFFAFWYGAVLSTFDFTGASSFWQVIVQNVKDEMSILVVLLIPLVPIVIIARETLIGNRMSFNRKDRTILRNRKHLMGFDEAESLLIKIHPHKSRHTVAELYLQSRKGKSVFLSRSERYEACAVLAEELAMIIHTGIKTRQISQ